MAEIDNLSISISADATTASKALDSLVSKIGTLSKTLGNMSGVREFSNSMSTLTTAMQGIKNVNASQFTKVAKGIQKFENIDSGKITAVSSAIEPLAQSINTLNGLTFDGKNITSFINSLAKLSNANAGSLNSVNFEAIGNSIRQMTSALYGAEDVSRNTIAITNAIAKLGATGGVIGQVTSELPSLAVALRTFISSMASASVVTPETTAFTAAIGQLASAGARTATTAANLDTLASALTRFFNTMASAPTVSNNIVQMTQALANLASQGKSVGSSSGVLVSGLNRFTSSAKKATKSTGGLASAFGKFYAKWWLLLRAFSKIGDAIELSSDLTEVQNVVDVAFKDYSDVMEDFASVSITDYGMTELTAKTIGSRYQAMANAIGLTTDEAAKANTFLSTMTDGYVEAGGSVADMSVNLTKLAADMASFYNVEQEDVAESLESIFTGTTKPLRQYGLDLTEATLKEWALKNGLDADIDSMTQAEKVMLRYQYVLANATDAEGDFARTADTWANRLRVLKQQLQAWGTIIGEVFINAFKPALRALNSFMTSVINATRTIADALGAIFGWTIDTSDTTGILDDTSDSAEDVADSLDDATDAAKSYKQQLQGFDELNVLTTDDSSSSDSDTDSDLSDYTISASSTSLTETDSLLDKYTSSIESLYELGEYISAALTKSMNSIDWDSIYQSAKDFGTGLASFLNGLISPELFGALGTTIAGSLNTVIYEALAFGVTFDFVNLGESLASGLENFFLELDAKALAEAISVWVKGALKAVSTFFKETDFEMIGKKIGEFLINLDWAEILYDIGEVIWNAIMAACEAWVGAFKEAPFETALISAIALWRFTNLGNSLFSKIDTALGTSLAGKTFSVSSVLKVVFELYFAYKVGDWIGSEIAKALNDEVAEILGDNTFFDYVFEFGFTEGLEELSDALSEMITGVSNELINFKEKVISEVEDIKSEIEQNKLSLTVELAGIDETILGIETIADAYYQLSQSSSLSDEDLAKLEKYKEQLEEFGLNVEAYINPETNAWTGSKEALEELIEAQREHLEVLAYEDAIIEGEKALIALEQELSEVEDKIEEGSYEDLVKAMQEMEKAGYSLNDIWDAINYTGHNSLDNALDYAYYFGTTSTSTVKNAYQLYASLKKVTSEYEKQEEYVSDLYAEVGILNGNVVETGNAIESGTKQLNTLGDILDEVADNGVSATDDIVKGLNEMASQGVTATTSLGEKMQEILGKTKPVNIQVNTSSAVNATTSGVNAINRATSGIKTPTLSLTTSAALTAASNGVSAINKTTKGITTPSLSLTTTGATNAALLGVNAINKKLSGINTPNINISSDKALGNVTTAVSLVNNKLKGITTPSLSLTTTGATNAALLGVSAINKKLSGINTPKLSISSTSALSSTDSFVEKLNKKLGGISAATLKLKTETAVKQAETLKSTIEASLKGINVSLQVEVASKVKDAMTAAINLGTSAAANLGTIKAYATGGFPDKSSLFLAGENGIPELLGTVGGQTAVAGGAEITGIADAVYNTGQTEASLLQTAVSLLNVIADKEYGITSNDLYKSVRQSDREYARRTGASGFMY